MIRRLLLFVLIASASASCSSSTDTPGNSILLHFERGKQLPSVPDSLLPIFPNPFNRVAGDTTITIRFNLRDSGAAVVLIQNPLGDQIIGFSDSTLSPGFYVGQWSPLTSNGTALNAGLYFVTLRTNSYINSRLVNIQENE